MPTVGAQLCSFIHSLALRVPDFGSQEAGKESLLEDIIPHRVLGPYSRWSRGLLEVGAKGLCVGKSSC